MVEIFLGMLSASRHVVQRIERLWLAHQHNKNIMFIGTMFVYNL